MEEEEDNQWRSRWALRHSPILVVVALLATACLVLATATVGSESRDVPEGAPSAASARLLSSAQAGTCSGHQEAIRPCNTAPCNEAVEPPTDCTWADWSKWTECECNGVQLRSRKVLVERRNGGRRCTGSEKQIRPCEGTCARSGAVDCEFGSWEPWSDCTKSCLGGQQYRTREIVRQPQNGGRVCSGHLDETRTCNTQECPGMVRRDCRWGSWGDWDHCSTSCGDGQTMRYRVIAQQPRYGGKLCDPATSSELERCKLASCVKTDSRDCMWSLWNTWSACTKTCGRGEMYRVRTIARDASDGGAPCSGVFETYKECNEAPCPEHGRDCALGPWTDWSDCSSTCQGHHARARAIAVQAALGGSPCEGSLEETRPCNAGITCGIPVVDCVYQSWLPWSFCSRSCGGGYQKRHRGIARHAQGIGKQCNGDLDEVKPCNEEACVGQSPEDCSWSSWGAWSSCTTTCGEGQRKRQRTIVIEAKNNGKPCEGGDAIELRECHQPLCTSITEVCEWGPWSSWSPCSRGGYPVQCGGGQRKRSRFSKIVDERLKRLDTGISIASGEAVGETSSSRRLGQLNLAAEDCKEFQDEVTRCAQAKCNRKMPVDCVWGAWQQWSACPCSGMHERHRRIAGAAEPGGKPCEGPEVEAEPCKSDCGALPIRNCRYSSWTEWSACPVTCGGGVGKDGTLVRYRTVTQFPQGGGKICEEGVIETQPCAVARCPEVVDCEWSQWSEYSACSVTCGGGEMSRSRQVAHLPQHGGLKCEHNSTMEVKMCNIEVCPTVVRDCEFSLWNDWQDCSQPCGGGQQHRTRILLVEATEDGRPCQGSLQDFQQCGMHPCDVKEEIDCQWGPWNSWSACTTLCNGHQERHRTIIQLPAKGGKTCDGAQKIMRGCNLDSATCRAGAPRDCVISDWSPWAHCSHGCDGGQKLRSRRIKVHAASLGKPCQGPLAQTSPCNTQPCTGEERSHDCRWNSWEDWDACTKSCDGGQRTRKRSIWGEAMGDGSACEASNSMEVQPCNTGSCVELKEVCGWGDWTPFTACTRSCGSGQQTRLRQKQWVSNSKAKAAARHRRLQRTSMRNTEDCLGTQKEIRPCGLMPCDVGLAPQPCKWSQWGEWAECGCNGLRKRVRDVARQAKDGGLPCVGPLEESESCEPALTCEPLNVDCDFGAWTAWSHCSATCGGGHKYHTRSVVTHAQAWGAGCSGSLEELLPCATQPCGDAQDCKYTDWTAWSACSQTCDGGQHSRSRSISSYPKHGGVPCTQADLQQLGNCNDQACIENTYGKVNCAWSVWTSWSYCSATCGTGQVRRTRIVVQKADNGGLPCDGMFQEFRDCTLTPCPHKDCTFSAWDKWSTCSDRCSGHQERSRGFQTFAVGGGKACTGQTKELRPCRLTNSTFCLSLKDSVDCKLSQWSTWSVCTRECGGGQRMSTRQVYRHPVAGGKPCADSLKKVEPCNMIYCPGDEPVDCNLGSWRGWHPCSASCGGGVMQRERDVATEPRNGGIPCAAANITQAVPCNTQPCNKGESCSWTEWTFWSACSQPCAGGQSKRSRSMVDLDLVPSQPALSNLEASEGPALSSRGLLTSLVLQHRLQLCGLAAVGAMTLVYLASLAWGRSRQLLQEAAAWQLLGGTPAAARYAPLSTRDPSTVGEEDEECPAFAGRDSHPLLAA
eukprot:TRINITY_DN21785_c0_g1_i2.p1 TRINITY_DN21785_c0_g1~~TRINITY_DN21785_c0_g1_i2.p1  ORF type:complete len:1661 (-),score=280.93 TRINITY_DN21785_c0_g1_i2:68-5050(-)